jgi:hypothetical protein
MMKPLRSDRSDMVRLVGPRLELNGLMVADVSDGGIEIYDGEAMVYVPAPAAEIVMRMRAREAAAEDPAQA